MKHGILDLIEHQAEVKREWEFEHPGQEYPDDDPFRDVKFPILSDREIDEFFFEMEVRRRINEWA